MHWQRWTQHGDLGTADTLVDPYDLCCTCNPPQADPAINYGQCPQCKRKPLALMQVRP